MKNLMVICALVAATTAFGTDYYVDAIHGNDAWDGTTDAIPTGEALEADPVHGPRRSLSSAMALTKVNNGDVVYAAPGTYDEGYDDPFRVRIPEGVKLIATGAQSETVIAGQYVSEVRDPAREQYGCGWDALRCVYVGKNAQLVGFTVSGGRSRTINPGYEYGQVGGIDGAGDGSLIVDCHVTDCLAGGYGGVRNVNAIRCHFTRNASISTGGIHMHGGAAWSCYFEAVPDTPLSDSGSKYGDYGVTLRNCEVLCRVQSCHAYNTYAPGTNGDTDFHYSNFYVLGTGSTADENCPAQTYSANMKYDENRRPVKGQNLGLDNGSIELYYGDATEAELAYLDKDYAGGQRIYNGAIDRGAGECDYRADFAPVLGGANNRFFTLDAVSPDVTATATELVLQDGGSAEWTWQIDLPPVEINFPMDYQVVLSATGDAVARLYVDDADEPAVTVVAADGVTTNRYTGGTTCRARVTVTGEGTVSVSQAKSTRVWYVDPNGSDANDGTAPTQGEGKAGPMVTLWRIMDKTTGGLGDIILAAPGVYNVGNYNAHRVRVYSGVKLIATEGPEVTVIEGQADSAVVQDEAPYGCGDGALDGVYLNANSLLQGFTVRNSHGRYWNTNTSNNGAIIGADRASSIVYHCIITNNYASCGAGVGGATAIRCLIADNYAGYSSANALQTSCYNCLMSNDWTPGGRFIYGYVSCTLNACTILQPNADAGANSCLIVNSYVENERDAGTLRQSAYTKFGDKTTIEDSAFSVKKEEMMMDAAWRPVAGQNKGIDKGSYEAYTNGVPERVLAYLGKDYAGGPRVYNGKLDLGCGEMDARPQFGAKLNRSRVTVTAATAGVETTDAGLMLRDGDRLELDCRYKTADEELTFKVSVTGEGTVTVLLNDRELLPDAQGVYRLTAESEADHLLISFAGDGTAVVSPFRSTTGVVLILR